MPSETRLAICRRVEADAVEALKGAMQRVGALRHRLQQMAFELQARGADTVNDPTASRSLAGVRADLAGAEMNVAHCNSALEAAMRAVKDAKREGHHGPFRRAGALPRVPGAARG